MAKRINLSRAAKRQKPTELDRWFASVMEEAKKPEPQYACAMQCEEHRAYGAEAMTNHPTRAEE